MLEKVARAIRSGRGCKGEVPCPFCYWAPDEHTAEWDETGCIWLASAALEALREPTREMLDAVDVVLDVNVSHYECYSERVDDVAATEVWQAMLDAAMREGK